MPAPITARHWRVRVTANNGSSYVGIGVFLSRLGVDLVTTGKTYSASSAPLGAPYTADAAWDMVVNGVSYWATGTGLLPAWIAVDMGVPVAVDRVDISVSTSANITESPRDFTIEYSDDGVAWSVALSQSGQTVDTGWVLGARRQFSIATPEVINLVFSQPQVATPGAVDLVFGEVEGSILINNVTAIIGLPGLGFMAEAAQPPIPATLVVGLPTLGFGARVTEPLDGTFVATMPGLGFAATATYDTNTERPLVGHTALPHQEAADLRTGSESGHQAPNAVRPGVGVHHQVAAPLTGWVQAVQPDSLGPSRTAASTTHAEADDLRTSARVRHSDGLRDRRPVVTTRAQEAIRLGIRPITTRHQERFRDRRPSLRTSAQQAVPMALRHLDLSGRGISIRTVRRTRAQEAMRPPAGRYTQPVQPPVNPCYTPDPHLLFKGGMGDSHLLFICDNHVEPPPPGQVVVPIRSVYIVLNDVYLKRVVGNVMLPATTVSMSIDVDSWTWSFSASLPSQALSDVEPIGGVPTELEVNINGSLYRVLAEQITRERVFGSSTIRVTGRGKSALLAAPYAPVMSFANEFERTAQQLMADVLSFNGVPLGWDIDWQLEDWLVPAGVFSAKGSYMDGLNAIVGAAGAYLQPHPTNQELSALLRYPVAPWAWGSVVPDFELPSAVMLREGIEWRTKPEYNRVFVSGQQAGVLGRVTRTGTAGDLLAPMVTDQLITSEVAARQRGIAILADTGRQGIVTLGLPVLPETGVIPPGKMVRYVDGSVTRTGITRAVSVDFSAAATDLKQTITVETHL